jgi:hypothetical protein
MPAAEAEKKEHIYKSSQALILIPPTAGLNAEHGIHFEEPS